MKRLALLIPVYNDQKGLEITLSALVNHAEPLDIWIVDDGSDVPVQVPKASGSNNIFVLRTPHNQGIVGALNTGLEQILHKKYCYIARLDAGDIPLTGRFAKQLERFYANPRLGLVGTHTEFVDAEGQLLYMWQPPTNPVHLRRFMHLQNPFVHSSVMFGSEVIRTVGCYSEKFSASEDYELFFRIAKRFEIAMVGEVLMRCDLNPNGLSVRKRNAQMRSALAIRLKNFDPLIIESYKGLLRGAISSKLPLSWVNEIKRLLWGGRR
jgi:glycosyltransferase involved in cell wall biosynthesis